MLFLISIVVLYFITILLLIYGFTKVKIYNATHLNPKTGFSIIVPFRNEAENLPLLLDSLSKMNYPADLFEVILVDDDSEDDFRLQSRSFGIDCRLQISIIDNSRVSNSPKKDAITTAIPLAKNNWIVSTDADCTAPENWLLTLDNYIQSHAVEMIAGAVTYNCKNSFLHHFQQLDLASLQGATIGSFGIGKGFMCNGANLAYTKLLFEKLNGFEGNEKIASGDDVFLLQKAIQSRNFGIEKVHYLKSENTIITTKPVDDWKSLFFQRVRWAAKTTSYQSNFGKLLGLIVFGGNISWWLIIIDLFVGQTNNALFPLLFAIKLSIDFILIYKTNIFLKSQTKSFVLGSLLYPFFSVSVALYSIFGSYQWKGRIFTK